jgi:hypothetical protein
MVAIKKIQNLEDKVDIIHKYFVSLGNFYHFENLNHFCIHYGEVNDDIIFEVYGVLKDNFRNPVSHVGLVSMYQRKTEKVVVLIRPIGDRIDFINKHYKKEYINLYKNYAELFFEVANAGTERLMPLYKRLLNV